VWEKNGTSLLTLPQHLRVALKDKLELLFNDHLDSSTAKVPATIKFVYTAKTREEKIALYERIKAGDGEGIVFKHCESDLSFKFKLYETTEALLVANSNVARNASLTTTARSSASDPQRFQTTPRINRSSKLICAKSLSLAV